MAPDLVPVSPYKGCPPDGPLIPRLTDLVNSKYTLDVAKDLNARLNSTVKGEIEAGWIVENVSFSLALVSPYGPSGSDDNGVTEVNGDTQYPIGSVSKVFSDLMLLESGLDLQAPVTDFLPQLSSPRSRILWEDITLEMLADHLAGIAPTAFFEFYFPNSFHESLGLPHLKDSEYPRCGVLGPNAGSTREEMIESFLTKEQVVPINSSPLYSQLSCTLYTLCLGEYTGKNYSQNLEETIYEPLSLVNSGVSPGDIEKAAIPPGVSGWGSDYGFNAPVIGGGLYSTINVMSIFSSVLNHEILDTPADIRKGLKPLSTISPLNTLHVHTVDICAKSGGAMGYMAQIAVTDQYGVGLAVLTAGPVDAMGILYRAVLGTFVPAIDEEARQLAGTWTSKPGNRTHGAERIRLILDLDDGTGFRLASFTRANASMIEAIQSIWTAQYLALGFGILPDELRVRDDEDDNNEEGDIQLVRQEWRINLDIVPLGRSLMSDLPDQNTATQYCGSWQTVDWMAYGGTIDGSTENTRSRYN
ncbi:beta-lactamase/transpeptidase-like protein [Aspergillus pseudodeflectus]|uniref:Beta-lactamase/transpeptidase-like protein n=1 Tax=Aspergillus pseudodeflectus TaxID=176178 RepID=A0ABR4KLA5_9EURO